MKRSARDRWRLPAILLGAGFAGWLWFGSENIPVRPAPVSAVPVAAEPERVAVSTGLTLRSRLAEVAAEPAETLEEMRRPIRLYGTAKVEALYDRHDFLGVQMKSVDEGSLWDLLGFQSGDLVLEGSFQVLRGPALAVSARDGLPVLLTRVVCHVDFR